MESPRDSTETRWRWIHVSWRASLRLGLSTVAVTLRCLPLAVLVLIGSLLCSAYVAFLCNHPELEWSERVTYPFVVALRKIHEYWIGALIILIPFFTRPILELMGRFRKGFGIELSPVQGLEDQDLPRGESPNGKQ